MPIFHDACYNLFCQRFGFSPTSAASTPAEKANLERLAATIFQMSFDATGAMEGLMSMGKLRVRLSQRLRGKVPDSEWKIEDLAFYRSPAT